MAITYGVEMRKIKYALKNCEQDDINYYASKEYADFNRQEQLWYNQSQH